MPRAERYADPRFRVVDGVCPHDCPDTCAWQVAVDTETGQAVDLWGHPDHPFTDGRLCGKVDHYLDRTYHAGRLTTPLRRVGAKGPKARFEAIGWDEALAEIAERTTAAIEAHGAETVLPYSYGGTMGYLQGEGMASRLWNRMGASGLGRTICATAGGAGLKYTMGASVGMDPLDFEHARLILLWGTNTLTSNMHLWPVIQRARKRGAKVIVIDPVRTRTARAADEWIPIRPGTDAALALGMANVLVREDLVDQEYLHRGTVGYDAFAERALEWDPARVEAITGIPAKRIVDLGRSYAYTRPAAIRINYGLQRHAGGGMAVRTIACLPALVGAWRERGGGLQLSSSGSFELDRATLDATHLLGDRVGDRAPRTINMIRLGEALSLDRATRTRSHLIERPTDPRPEDPGPPVHALYVYNCNPAAVAPDQGAVLAGLQREDLFTVVLEHFQTDTADYADIVLPATTQMEHWDVVKPYGHLYLALNQPAIEPVGEARPNSEIFRGIAAAMGYEDPEFREGDLEILRRLIDDQNASCMEGIDFDRLEREGFCRLNLPEPFLPFVDGVFPTPSGKCELRSQTMEDHGYDALPTWTPPAVGRGDGDESDGTLHMISPPAHSFLNTSFVNIERFSKREKHPEVVLHPDDAESRSITDGDEVVVSNGRGEVRLRARVSDEVVRGCAVAWSIWWNKLSPDGRNVNWLTPPDQTDMGGGAVFFDVPVRVCRRTA